VDADDVGPDEAGVGGTGTALVAVDQRHVALLDEDDILAVRTDDGDIYIPVRALCSNLGLARSPQMRRIRADVAMTDGLRDVRVQTPQRGVQTMQCLRLDVVPYWLSGVEVSRIKEHLRARLVAYKRWVVRRVWEAFSAETGLGQALQPTAPSVPVAAQEMSLEQIAQLGLAITTLARQQLAYEQALGELRGHVVGQDAQLADHDARLGAQEARFERAAEVIRDVIHDVRTIQTRLSAGATINDEQAATIQTLVRDIATAIMRRDAAAGPSSTRPNAYQALFGAMYRQFSVTSYKLIRADRYGEVVAWLQEYRQAQGV